MHNGQYGTFQRWTGRSRVQKAAGTWKKCLNGKREVRSKAKRNEINKLLSALHQSSFLSSSPSAPHWQADCTASYRLGHFFYRVNFIDFPTIFPTISPATHIILILPSTLTKGVTFCPTQTYPGQRRTAQGGLQDDIINTSEDRPYSRWSGFPHE